MRIHVASQRLIIDLHRAIEYISVIEALVSAISSTIEVESLSVEVISELASKVDCGSMHTILTTFYHIDHFFYSATGDVVKLSQHYWFEWS